MQLADPPTYKYPVVLNILLGGTDPGKILRHEAHRCNFIGYRLPNVGELIEAGPSGDDYIFNVKHISHRGTQGVVITAQCFQVNATTYPAFIESMKHVTAGAIRSLK